MSFEGGDLALSVRDLGKSYEIDESRGRQGYTLSESILERIRHPFARKKRSSFWAARDISFDIHCGEVVGLIGRNGAGKSTLLKLLSRITPPTTGRIDIWGRVGSLLEVGTGFHPELTGRENIFMNGAILGMTRAEIQRQFDAIVEFAEVSKFLETPVKRYSSGMYVRLAFAVAAHLNPEILIVDEVLAVGDAAFQKKCLGKMNDVAREGGRTVLFVSHNMAAVRALCTRALLLSKGSVALDADTDTVAAAYMRAGGSAEDSTVDYERPLNLESTGFQFLRGHVLDEDGDPLVGALDCSSRFTIAAEYEATAPIRGLRIGFELQNAESVTICGADDAADRSGTVRGPGRFETQWTFPGYLLNEGLYSVGFYADVPNEYKIQQTTRDLAFHVDDLGSDGVSQKRPGVLRPRLLWDERFLGSDSSLEGQIRAENPPRRS